MSFLLFSLPVLLLALFYRFRHVGRRPKDFPPGPPTLPIIGNLHQMPKSRPHLQFKKWADEYGPIYSLILGTSVMIVLSSDVAIKDLLDKRSGIYSSRPPFSVGQMISGGQRMLLMEYGKEWRMIRKAVHDHLNITASRSYIPYQDLENRQMLIGILERPEQWEAHLGRYTNSLTTQIVYGFRATDIGDAKVAQLFECLENFSECLVSPSAQLVDVFPFIKYLSACVLPVKKRAKKLHKKERALFLEHWFSVKERIQNGTANPCLCVDLVNSQKAERFTDLLASYIAGSLLEAGSDTTYSTLLGFVQAMLLFPEVAKRAQEEIDRVCGGRFPTLEDEAQLKYVRGCVKESMRWMPTAVMGVPHAVIRDDAYMGYRIPKGASILSNVWAVHHNPTRHLNPHVFDPTRYTNDPLSAAESATHPDPTKRDHFVFGTGRRICQGMHIADRSLFLAISRLLWAFDILPAPAGHGNSDPITPDPTALTEGFLVKPKKFPASFEVRSEKKAEVLREEWRRVSVKLNKEGQWESIPQGMFFKEYVPLAV